MRKMTRHSSTDPQGGVLTPRNDWARQQLPPANEWPIMHREAPYDYPDALNAAARLLDDALHEGHANDIALRCADASGEWSHTSYGALAKHVSALAHVLSSDLGLVPGDRVLLRGFNGQWMVAAWLATLKAGCVAVTTMPLLRAVELRAVQSRARCAAALCDVRLIDELMQALDDDAVPCAVRSWGTADTQSLTVACSRHVDPFPTVRTHRDDISLIAFTSGTTGEPKGCMHSHGDVMAMCDGFSQQVLGTTANDRCIGTPPIAFTFGLGGLVCFPLAARGSAVLLEKASPEMLLESIAHTKSNVCFTAPTFYRQMALAMQREPSRFDTSTLRACVSAGEALPDATRTLWRECTGIEMLDGIGATELIHIFVAAAGEQVRQGAIGRAVPGYEVAIFDDALHPVAAGVVGRLAVRGPTGCRYLNDPRQRDYVQHGWNLTGDAAFMDAEGYVYFTSRTDDLIISSGHNIGAPEVEAAVLTHEQVAECAVIGIPDEDRGQLVKAFVVLREDAVPNEALVQSIQNHVKRSIAPYKYPRLVAFVDALPKTETGKLQRFRLREHS